MNIPQELLYQQYVRRELETYRAPYDPEAEFYSYVRQGNTKKIKEYIANQLQEDRLSEQLTMEYLDPFTGSK